MVLFCGLPGSGKTTVASIIATKIPRAVLVQTDRLRSMLTRPKYTSSESKFVYAALMAVGAEALDAGYNTLLEGTFPREEYRSEVLDALSPRASKALVVYMDCDPELAFERNIGRRESVPLLSFQRIYTQFEIPRRAIRVDTSSVTSDEAAAIVVSALQTRSRD